MSVGPRKAQENVNADFIAIACRIRASLDIDIPDAAIAGLVVVALEKT